MAYIRTAGAKTRTHWHRPCGGLHDGLPRQAHTGHVPGNPHTTDVRPGDCVCAVATCIHTVDVPPVLAVSTCSDVDAQDNDHQ